MGNGGSMRRIIAMTLGAGLFALVLAGCTGDARQPVTISVDRPTAAEIDPVAEYARDRLATMTLDEKIRSMFMVHLAGTDAGQIGGFAAANGAGGVILMGDNIPDPPDALATMTPAIAGEEGLPLLIAIDQEGGIVARIWTDAAPSAAELRYADPAAARAAFETRGSMLESLGVTVNFGIVADVTGDASSFIFERSLGATGTEAGARVAEAVEGEKTHVLSTLKHFPGHGVAPGDSHSSIPSTGMGIDEWRATHEQPFADGIDAGAELVMFGHLQFDAIDPRPATLSPFWHELVRDELGFDGIIITDDMGMLQNSGVPQYADPASNAVQAVAAGATMLLYVGPVDVGGVTAAIHAAVDAGTVQPSQIDEAAELLLVERRTLSGLTGPFVRCDEACQRLVD